MHHSQLIRIVRTSLRPVFLNPSLSRGYTVPPPVGPAAPKKQADNTLMYTTLGLVATAGAFYYFRNTDEAQDLKNKAKAEQDHMKSKSAELGDAAKVRAEDVKQQGKAKWDQVKTSSKEKLGSEVKEAETRGGGLVADLEAKYDSVKGSAKENMTRARDSTENLYNEARSLGEQKAANVRDDAHKKVDQAKNGWSSWFNWGKSKADDIESEAEHLRSKGAQTVANSAENVKERGEKHA